MWNILSLNLTTKIYHPFQKIDNTKFGTIKNYNFSIQVKNQYSPAKKT